MNSTITASIVLYKPSKEVHAAIDSILNSSIDIKLFLVDNSPTNEFSLNNPLLIAHPDIEYIFNNKNIGFGAAHNIAIKKCIDISSFHLVVNPDVYFGNKVIESLYQYMESNKDIGHVMPKILYPEGNLQYVAKLLPTPFDLISRRFFPAVFTKKRLSVFELHSANYTYPFEAPYLSGCFMFLRTSALKKVGFFDENFFMYPEDIDLTRRINKHFKTVCYPLVTVYHEHGKGSYKSLKMLKIHIVNIIRYFNKWGWFSDKERSLANKKTLQQFKLIDK